MNRRGFFRSLAVVAGAAATLALPAIPAKKPNPLAINPRSVPRWKNYTAQYTETARHIIEGMERNFWLIGGKGPHGIPYWLVKRAA